ncbi:MAG: hypothetical protein ABJA79_02050 [Parafilimonas sp.]
MFEQNEKLAGKVGGGIMHFGFRLVNAADIGKVIAAVKNANRKIIRQENFSR